MLTRNTIKLIKSLQQKKFRREHGLFVVEGGKSVQEALASDWPVHTVYCTESYLPELERALRRRHIEPVLAKAAELAEGGSPALLASAAEFILEGLAVSGKISISPTVHRTVIAATYA